MYKNLSRERTQKALALRKIIKLTAINLKVNACDRASLKEIGK